jgi:hypothetical protein
LALRAALPLALHSAACAVASAMTGQSASADRSAMPAQVGQFRNTPTRTRTRYNGNVATRKTTHLRGLLSACSGIVLLSRSSRLALLSAYSGIVMLSILSACRSAPTPRLPCHLRPPLPGMRVLL